MAQGRFLSNIHDPKDPNARMYFTLSVEASLGIRRADFEWQNHLDWIAKNSIGKPKATDAYSVEDLEKMGMVGIYSNGS